MSFTETLLCLVRHGETEWNAAGRLQGRTDIPLNERGRAQAQSVAKALAKRAEESGRPWTALYTSPLQRAYETAQAIGASLRLAPQVREALVERAFGALEGRTREENERLFPDWRGRPEEIEGLESEAELRVRASGSLEGIAKAHEGGRVVVVSHGGLLNAFLHVASGGRVGTGKTRLANVAISVVVRREGRWHVEEVNRSEHVRDLEA